MKNELAPRTVPFNINFRRRELDADLKTNVVVVGAGPAGSSAAEFASKGGLKTTLLEQNPEIGKPVRTSGGTSIEAMGKFDIPETLWHPIQRVLFLSRNERLDAVTKKPLMCAIDVTGTFQHLAKRASQNGTEIMLNTRGIGVVKSADGFVIGVKAQQKEGEGKRDLIIGADIVVDASGYSAIISKEAGLHSGNRRLGVGAEYDFYAPNCDQNTAVVVVGNQIPSGYGWVLPWGKNRVRVGVGIIHPDSKTDVKKCLEEFVRNAHNFETDLTDAKEEEYHYGLIPAEGLVSNFVGNGIMAVGDSARQASTLLGEGIRWSIEAGQMAGEAAVQAISQGDVSRKILYREYQRKWDKKHGKNLFLAQKINRRISKWGDDEWDGGVRMLKMLPPKDLIRALSTDLVDPWIFKTILKHPSIILKIARGLIG